jgi:prepilin-type processing-associated H-X9-DG protein
MKLTTYPKTIFCLTLLLGWGNCAPPATAQYQGTHALYQDIFIPVPPQTVEVHTPRDSYNAGFHSEIRVFRNAEANGFLMLDPTDSTHPGGANFTFGDGSVRFNRDGTVAGVLLRGRTIEGDPVVVIITPAEIEDCLIYTTVGPDVNATWEAQGRLIVICR